MQLTIACSCGDGRPRPSKVAWGQPPLGSPSRAQLGSCLWSQQLLFGIRPLKNSGFVSGHRFSDAESLEISCPFRGWASKSTFPVACIAVIRRHVALEDRSRALSNLPFDGGNAFRLDGWVIAKPGQPMHIRLSTEPGNLALGIVTMRL